MRRRDDSKAQVVSRPVLRLVDNRACLCASANGAQSSCPPLALETQIMLPSWKHS